MTSRRVLKTADRALSGPSRPATGGVVGRGYIVIWTIVVIVSMIGFLSFAIDWGRVQLAKSQLIVATNAAARAALVDRAAGTTVETTAAVAYAAKNLVDGTPLVLLPGDVTPGNWNPTSRVFVANATPANAVRVVGVRNAARSSAVPLAFGGLFGISRVNLSFTAIVAARRDRQVDLSTFLNTDAMVVDGTSFGTGGLDLNGWAFSDTLIAGAIPRGDSVYTVPRGSPDAVRCASQTIPLPAGAYKSVVVVVGQGNGPVTSVFTLNNRDGTTTAYSQSVSDWCVPRTGVLRETTCSLQSYRIDSSGTRVAPATQLVSYEFPIVSAGGASSLKLPTMNKLVVFAVALTQADGSSVR